jgi:D-3-phosphoglycerate dehydrogenase
MTDAVEALILDLLEWVAQGERAYDEVMEAWRTSCPRLPVWEEANARGLVTRTLTGGAACVAITPAGRALLASRNSSVHASLSPY